MTGADDAQLLEQLDQAGAALAKADAIRAEAMAQVREALNRGNGRVDIAEMSRRCGISRTTAYRLLDKQ